MNIYIEFLTQANQKVYLEVDEGTILRAVDTHGQLVKLSRLEHYEAHLETYGINYKEWCDSWWQKVDDAS